MGRMQSLGRLLALVIAGLIGIAFALAVVLALTRIYLQHRNAAALAIRTPQGIDEERYDRIEAPRKAFALLPGTGHLAVWTAPDAFLRRLRTMLADS